MATIPLNHAGLRHTHTARLAWMLGQVSRRCGHEMATADARLQPRAQTPDVLLQEDRP